MVSNQMVRERKKCRAKRDRTLKRFVFQSTNVFVNEVGNYEVVFFGMGNQGNVALKFGSYTQEEDALKGASEIQSLIQRGFTVLQCYQFFLDTQVRLSQVHYSHTSNHSHTAPVFSNSLQ